MRWGDAEYGKTVVAAARAALLNEASDIELAGDGGRRKISSKRANRKRCVAKRRCAAKRAKPRCTAAAAARERWIAFDGIEILRRLRKNL